MTENTSGRLAAAFRFIIAKRWWVVALYALLLVPSVYFAVQVPQDNSLDRLIVQSDPDYIAARDFGKVVRVSARDPERKPSDAVDQLLAARDRPGAGGLRAAAVLSTRREGR